MNKLNNLTATKRTSPPTWAVLERQLIDAIDQTASIYIDKYTRSDGSLNWIKEYPGDGVWVDDLYEAFFNWPLYYSLGGSEYIGKKAVDQWNAVTRQVTDDYGRIADDFVCNDDWFHNAENYVYFYALGLSDPSNTKMMERALRFSGFYLAENKDIPNYDPIHHIIRSPFSGSLGPLSHARWNDVRYNIEHGHTTLLPNFEIPSEWTEHPGSWNRKSSGKKLWWEDPKKREQIHALFDKIVMEGDVPVNLSVVGLVAHTFTLTGEEKYRRWIVDYVGSWMDRIEKNGGIIPDNVGLNVRIGENRDGQWWGGFYGWMGKYSHQMMFSAMTVASTCAHMVTGDKSYLDLARSQLDLLLDKAVEREGQLLVPHRHNEKGWTDFGPMGHQPPIHLWFASQEERDWQRLEMMYQGVEEQWNTVRSNDLRSCDDRAWIRYLAGDCPQFPEAILQGNYREMMRRMDLISNDEKDLTDPAQSDVHHWLNRNPIHTEALQVLTTGAPQTIYWGGIARGRVRYFDTGKTRPGLPQDVAALVSSIQPDGINLTLVNLSPYKNRELTVQAGTFGEHRFTTATSEDNEKPILIDANHFNVSLSPGCEISLSIGMKLHSNTPSCALPWHKSGIPSR